MRMAKASENDMEASILLLGVLNDIDSGQFPRGINGKFDESAPDYFDEDDQIHLFALYNRIKYCLDIAPGGLTRVIAGFHTIAHNNILDPDDECLALHPRFKDSSVHEVAA